jgi:calcineurin-like phosphoesterase family protein
MRIWITSDTHFSHKGALKWRPRDFEKQIKEHLKKNIKSEDLLIHLGDVSLGDEHPNHHWFKQKLHCRTVLVIGNHDKRTVNWYMNNGWDFACATFSMKFQGLNILFSHIPQDFDKNFYDLNIHGHLHENNHRKQELDFNVDDKSFFLISLEFSKYQPIMLDEIIKQYERKKCQEAKKIRLEGTERIPQATISLQTEMAS